MLTSFVNMETAQFNETENDDAIVEEYGPTDLPWAVNRLKQGKILNLDWRSKFRADLERALNKEGYELRECCMTEYFSVHYAEKKSVIKTIQAACQRLFINVRHKLSSIRNKEDQI